MKIKRMIQLLFIILLTACQATSNPSSINTTTNQEFMLTPGQSAAVTDADLTIMLNSILNDERCPSEVECEFSGPVTVSISVQQGNDTPNDFTLQVFTGYDGRTTGRRYEGIEDRVEIGEHLIQVVGVTPYPKDRSTKIEPFEYHAAFLITQE